MKAALATPTATISSSSATIPTAAEPNPTVGRHPRVVAPTEGCLIADTTPQHHRHDRRHEGHGNTDEGHRPDQRQLRCGESSVPPCNEGRITLMGDIRSMSWANFGERRRGEVRRIEPRLFHRHGLTASAQLPTRVDDADIKALSAGDGVPRASCNAVGRRGRMWP